MTETTPEQQTADLIRKRLLEIAPEPSDDTPDHALALAKVTAVDAQRFWHRNMSRHPFYSPDWDEAAKLAWADSIHAQSFAFATAHLLLALHRVSPEAANEASRQINDAWEYGEGVGEWVWLHCHDLGIDPAEVDRLEDAWQALPSSRPAAPEPDANGLESAAEDGETPEPPAGTVALWRKRPVTVEARQWDGYPVTATVLIDWILANGGTVRYHDGPSALSINTLEGTMTAVPGDWIIKGVANEFYPCKDEIFRETYEPAGSIKPEPGGDHGETTGTSGILGLNAGNLVRWSGAAAPGGYVCATPVPGNPDGICGEPVESEPCSKHRDKNWRPE